MNSFLLSQILVGIAFFFGIISFQNKDRDKILLCWCASSLFTGIHFIFLNQQTPAVISIITSIRFFVASRTHDKRIMYLFMTLNIVSFILTVKAPISALPFTAAMIGTFASFHKADKYLRIFLMSGTLMWIIHNTYVGSPTAVIMEICFLTSNIVGLFRYYILKKSR